MLHPDIINEDMMDEDRNPARRRARSGNEDINPAPKAMPKSQPQTGFKRQPSEDSQGSGNERPHVSPMLPEPEDIPVEDEDIELDY